MHALGNFNTAATSAISKVLFPISEVGSNNFNRQIKEVSSSSNEAEIQKLEAEIQKLEVTTPQYEIKSQEIIQLMRSIGQLLDEKGKAFVASQSSPYPHLGQRKARKLVAEKLAEPTPFSDPELLNGRENRIKVREIFIRNLAPKAHTIMKTDINKTLKERPEALARWVYRCFNAASRETSKQGNNPIDFKTLAVFEEYGQRPIWNCYGFAIENKDNIEASTWAKFSESYKSWRVLAAEDRENQSFKSFALGQQRLTEHEWNHVDTLLTNWKNMAPKEMERLSNLGFTRAMHIDSKRWKGVIEGGKLGQVREIVVLETADNTKYQGIKLADVANWQDQSDNLQNIVNSIPLVNRIYNRVMGKELSDHQRDFALAHNLNFEELQSVVDKKGDLTKLGQEMISKLHATLKTNIEKSFLDDPSVLPRLIHKEDLREWEENWEKQCTEPDFFLKWELKVLKIAEKDIETICSLEKKFENDPSTDHLKKALLANGFSEEVVETVKVYRDNKPQNTGECIERAAQLFSSMYNLPPYAFLQLVMDNHALVYKGYDREPSHDHRSARQSSAVQQ